VASRTGLLPNDLAELGVAAVRCDRDEPNGLAAALGGGADVVVDIVAFEARHAEQLNALAPIVGSLVVVSSASVYVDDEGRTLDEAESIETFPRLPVPIPETQRTVQPSPATYSTQKVAVEQAVLAGPLPATVVRPCAVHGPGSELPRELFFVKRILDGRRRVLLVCNGESRFHTTSVRNLAELVRLAAERPADRVLNCGDRDPPSVLEICSAVCTALDAALEPVLVPESSYELGRALGNPWAVPFPFVVDMHAAARELGYHPVVTYPEAVRDTVDWLVAEGAHQDWSGTYLERFVDYAAEDAALG
jgi:nucleoside-diphosphate-sugar epimerase